MKKILVMVSASALGLCSASAVLELPIVNYSFEEPVLPDGTYTVNTIPGWLGEGSWYHVANPNDSYFPGTTDSDPGPSPIDGHNAAAVNNFGHILYQNLTETVQPNSTYTLTVLVGHRLGVPIDDVSVNLVAGGRFLARVFPNPPEGTFAQVTLEYDSPASGSLIGQPMQIELRSAGGTAQGWFDNVHLYRDISPTGTQPSVDTPFIPIPGGGGGVPGGGSVVPEPSTWVAGACLAGVLGLSAWRERKCRNGIL